MSSSRPSSPANLRLFNFLSAHLPSRWTQHETLLGPRQVMMSLIHMTVLGVKGYTQVLDSMKKDIGSALGWGDRVPSASALTQARRKVGQETVRAVFRAVAGSCLAAARRPALRFGDHRVLCCDGTMVALPSHPKLRETFRCPENQHGEASAPQAGLVVLWDPGRSLPIDFRITTGQPHERDALIDMLPSLGPGDVVLGDRGYPSWAMFTALRAQRVDFVIRLSRCWSREVDAFIDSGDVDRVIDWIPCDSTGFSDNETASMRLVKIPHRDPDQPPRIIATSLLDAQRYPRLELDRLYHQRWCIETAFREMKVSHGLERIHARTAIGVCQEITAVMLFLLFAAEFEALIRETYADDVEEVPAPMDESAVPPTAEPIRLERWPVRFRRPLLCQITVDLLGYCMAGDTQRAIERFRGGAHYLWRMKEKPRPGRSFPRVAKSPNAKQRRLRAGRKDA